MEEILNPFPPEKSPCEGEQMFLQRKPLPYVPTQIDAFTTESALIRPSGRIIHPAEMKDKLREIGESKPPVAVFEVGGTNCWFRPGQINEEGLFVPTDELCEQNAFRLNDPTGKSYADFIGGISSELDPAIPIAFNAAGRHDGHKYIPTNSPGFRQYLQQHEFDLRCLFPEGTTVVSLNDAEAGVTGLVAEHPDLTENGAILLIQGTGLGVAVWDPISGRVIPTEGGHPRLDPNLNPHEQTLQHCSVHDDQRTCLEWVGSGKGVESLARRLYDNPTLTGPDIGRLFGVGYETAVDLYDNAARIGAHAALGIAHATSLPGNLDGVAVGLHGSLFDKIPGYPWKTDQYLTSYTDARPQVVLSGNVPSGNLSNSGAAYLAALEGY
ncbi:ROK family protein [Candidatus Dojkabacteria bacterium]|nr:ROK family protein [Candidatus Dojkabacteria bacterium]